MRWPWLWLGLWLSGGAAVWAQRVLRHDTTWGGAGPVRVEESMVVPQGVTLTIEPGTVIVFAPNPRRAAEEGGGGLFLRVEGTLRALGTPEEPIYFLGANARSSPPSDWDIGRPYDTLQGWNQFRGLIFTATATPFREGAQSGCLLRDVVFVGAYEPVRVEGSAVRLERCTFLRSGAGGDRGGGITLYGGVAEHCVFEWSGAYALRLGQGAEATHCLLDKGFGDGIWVEGPARITNCLIQRFAGAGIDLRGEGVEILYTRIERCSVGLRVSVPWESPPFLYSCTLANLGWPRPGGAILIERPPQGPPPRFIKFDTEGGGNRILSSPALQDRVGGVEVFLKEVWWGLPNPPSGPPLFQGQKGSQFHIFPALEQDPWQNTWAFQGTIADGWNRPLSEVLVWLRDSNIPPERTASDGTFRFAGVQPGWYFLRLYRPGWGYLEKKLDWFLGNPPYALNAFLPAMPPIALGAISDLRVVRREADGSLLLEGVLPPAPPLWQRRWRYDVRWSPQPLQEDGTDACSWVRAEMATAVEGTLSEVGSPTRWRVRFRRPPGQGFLAMRIWDSLGRASPLSESVPLP